MLLFSAKSMLLERKMDGCVDGNKGLVRIKKLVLTSCSSKKSWSLKKLVLTCLGMCTKY